MMFKSKKELALALIEGRKFRLPNGAIIYFDEHAFGGSPFRYREPHSNEAFAIMSSWDRYNEVEEIEPWTPEVGEPALFWSYPDERSDPILGFFLGRSKEGYYLASLKMTAEATYYTHIKPLPGYQYTNPPTEDQP